MHDRFKKRFRGQPADDRVRRQIAVEAARRLLPGLGEEDPAARLSELTDSALYTAKRKAAAVLGHPVRPGDLPSDGEVREQVLALLRDRQGAPSEEDPDE